MSTVMAYCSGCMEVHFFTRLPLSGNFSCLKHHMAPIICNGVYATTIASKVDCVNGRMHCSSLGNQKCVICGAEAPRNRKGHIAALLEHVVCEVVAGSTLGHLPATFPDVFKETNRQHQEDVRGELERVYPAVLATMILERAYLPL